MFAELKFTAVVHSVHAHIHTQNTAIIVKKTFRLVTLAVAEKQI